MKKFKIFVAASLFLIVYSCIPSLHPIYTDQNRITDDRLIGDWVSSEKNDKSISFTFEVSSDDSLDQKEGIKLMEDFWGSEEENNWKFERAGAVTASYDRGESNNASISMSLSAKSMIPKGFELDQFDPLPFYMLTHTSYEREDTIKDYMLVNLTYIGEDLYMDFYPYSLKDKQMRTRFASNHINGHTFAKVMISDNKVTLQSFNQEYISDLIKNKRVRIKHEILGEDQILLTASTNELRAFIEKYGNDPELYDTEETLVLN